jgi:predicted protein tyrosine phosphatase
MTINRLNILFICSKNKWRSPTAEAMYRHDRRLNVRSAGTCSSAKKRISEKDLSWADLILVMENEHKKRIISQYGDRELPQIIVLDIPDEYQYMDRELIANIKISVEDILKNIDCIEF